MYIYIIETFITFFFAWWDDMQGGLALHRNCNPRLSYYYQAQFLWLWWLCMVIHWGGYSIHCIRAWFRQPSHCTKSIIKLNREPFSAWTSPDHDDDDNTDDLLKFKHKEKDGFYSLLKAGDLWDTPAYSRKGSWRPEGGRRAHHHHHRQPANVPALHSSAQ